MPQAKSMQNLGIVVPPRFKRPRHVWETDDAETVQATEAETVQATEAEAMQATDGSEAVQAEEAQQPEDDAEEETDEVSSDTAAEAALQAADEATAESTAQLAALLAVILTRLDHIEGRLEREFHDIFRRLMELEGVP